jgi:hypothetical protein
MKVFFLAIFLSFSALAETSKLIPAFMDAVDIYLSPELGLKNSMVLNAKTRAILSVLENKKIDPAVLLEFTQGKSRTGWKLPEDDQFDRWQKAAPAKGDVPEVALQAFKLDVVKTSDWFKDDVYAYFFITDGVIPTGKVTTIYKGVATGQSFFFNEVDRAIFPLMGIPAKKPNNHLIVDYGIIESDGDDIKKMQQLSDAIIDIAIAVYAAYDPEHGDVVIKLRKEIKALADMLLTMNSDDRLVTSSFGFKAQELNDVFKNETYVEFKRNHKAPQKRGWEYDVHFRLLKN